MRRGLQLVLLAALAALGCDRATVVVTEPTAPAPVQRPEDDPLVIHEAVREAVREYDAALAARDSASASALVIDETFTHYEDLRRLALTATRDELERLDLMSVMLVLQLRNGLSRPELDALDGRALFELSVAAGLVGGGDNDDVALDEVWLDDEQTRAEVRVDGQAVAFLRLVDERWRMDIPASIHMLGQVLGSLARERIAADGKVFTAMVLLQRNSAVDPAIADGPLDEIVDDAASAGSQSPEG